MTDPILQDLLQAAATAGDTGGAVIRLVADGIVWQGRLYGPASWAGATAATPPQDDVLRDSVTDGTGDLTASAREYVHFVTASFLAGGGWHRADRVRIAADTVSAWWLHRDEG